MLLLLVHIVYSDLKEGQKLYSTEELSFPSCAEPPCSNHYCTEPQPGGVWDPRPEERFHCSEVDIIKIQKLYGCKGTNTNVTTTQKPENGVPTTIGGLECKDMNK